jgi:hypothetical protein
MPHAEEPELIYSDLQTPYAEGGRSVEIAIYRSADTDWLLEITADDGHSTVWEDPFDTDEAALAEALQALKEEGIDAFFGDAATPTQH